MSLQRAYSALDIKAISSESRTLRGMATTPAPDRAGDIIEPAGVQSVECIPLFLYHDSRLTVGTVRLGKATPAGIPFEASIPKVVEPGRLQQRVDEAWQMVKYKLIAAVSIGFRPIGAIHALKDGARRFLESEVLELSLVPIPMNSQATITDIKGFSSQVRADLGLVRTTTANGGAVRLITARSRGVPLLKVPTRT